MNKTRSFTAASECDDMLTRFTAGGLQLRLPLVRSLDERDGVAAAEALALHAACQRRNQVAAAPCCRIAAILPAAAQFAGHECSRRLSIAQVLALQNGIIMAAGTVSRPQQHDQIPCRTCHARSNQRLLSTVRTCATARGLLTTAPAASRTAPTLERSRRSRLLSRSRPHTSDSCTPHAHAGSNEAVEVNYRPRSEA